MVVLISAVRIMCNIVYLMLLARCVCSWLYGMRNPVIGKIDRICTDLTEWLVAPCRKLISRWNNGMIDWSVFLAFILLGIIERVLIKVLYMIMI
ncbi:MAG: YggT family protein [Clostridiales bacterium]|nr:YggT family protein [Clostridiales bacterium]MDD6390080.1 YggT family protein [Bacillota bacterium]MDY5975759.1 YggT family protein [Anaerovoracaceae bacterium]